MCRIMAILATLGLTSLAVAEDKKADTSKLEGTYKIVSGEKEGKPLSDVEINGSLVTIKGNKIMGTDKDKKEFFAATFTIDSSTTPHKISMISTAPKDGGKAEGVIELQGDMLKICYALPGGEAPDSFKSKVKQQCFVMKRIGQ